MIAVKCTICKGMGCWGCDEKGHTLEECLVCDDCKTEKDTARQTTCPYQADVYNFTIACVLCEECYTERCYAI